MTDNEIIKDMGTCIKYREERECGNCSRIGRYQCAVTLMKDAFDLINRQNAENERLLQKLQQVKFEAYREFAEKVKPILKEMFDLMIDDDEGKCIVENCKKHSSFPCMNEYCIKENWEEWEAKVDNTLKEPTESNERTILRRNK